MPTVSPTRWTYNLLHLLPSRLLEVYTKFEHSSCRFWSQKFWAEGRLFKNCRISRDINTYQWANGRRHQYGKKNLLLVRSPAPAAHVAGLLSSGPFGPYLRIHFFLEKCRKWPFLFLYSLSLSYPGSSSLLQLELHWIKTVGMIDKHFVVFPALEWCGPPRYFLRFVWRDLHIQAAEKLVVPT